MRNKESANSLRGVLIIVGLIVSLTAGTAIASPGGIHRSPCDIENCDCVAGVLCETFCSGGECLLLLQSCWCKLRGTACTVDDPDCDDPREDCVCSIFAP